jgi:hypothetical protein
LEWAAGEGIADMKCGRLGWWFLYDFTLFAYVCLVYTIVQHHGALGNFGVLSLALLAGGLLSLVSAMRIQICCVGAPPDLEGLTTISVDSGLQGARGWAGQRGYGATQGPG